MGEGSAGKTVHVVGAGLLAIVAVCARFADDCGRAGLRGSSLLDDGARVGRGGLLADDAARGLPRGATLADDALHEAGHMPRSPGRSIYGRPTSADNGAGLLEEARAAGGGSHSASIEVTKTALDVSLDVGSLLGSTEPNASAQRRRFAESNVVTPRPALLELLPTTQRAYEQVYGAGPGSGSLTTMRATAGVRPKPGLTEARGPSQRIADHKRHNPLGVLLYADGEVDLGKHIALVLPDGEATDEAEVHRSCIAHGLQCVVLVCAAESTAARGTCGETARQVWTTAAAVDRGAVDRFLGALLDAREASPEAREIVISRLEFDATAEQVSLVHSRARG